MTVIYCCSGWQKASSDSKECLKGTVDLSSSIASPRLQDSSAKKAKNKVMRKMCRGWGEEGYFPATAPSQDRASCFLLACFIFAKSLRARDKVVS